MKNRTPPVTESVRHQEFVYDDCDYCVTVLNKCLMVDTKCGVEKRGPVVAEIYRLPLDACCPHETVCVRVIDCKETVTLTLDRWPSGSFVLMMLNLPLYLGDAPASGDGGKVVWDVNDSGAQIIRRYLRGPASKSDLRLRREELAKRDRSRSLRLPAELKAGGGGRVVARRRAKPARVGSRKVKGWSRVSGLGLGNGYVVADAFWVAADGGRVVQLDGNIAEWCPVLFTRMVLKAMLENKQPEGMTSEDIYDEAVKLYKQAADGAGNKGVRLPDIPSRKSLGQFFRVKAGEAASHPLLGAVVRSTDKQTRYVLKGTYVASDERLDVSRVSRVLTH